MTAGLLVGHQLGEWLVGLEITRRFDGQRRRFDDLRSVPTSYPAFFDTLAGLGGALIPEETA